MPQSTNYAENPHQAPQIHSDLWVETEHDGRILAASQAALALLLGYSARSVAGRWLPIMFLADRPTEATLARVLLGHPIAREGMIRPKDQRGKRVAYRIELAPDSTDQRPILQWTFKLTEATAAASKEGVTAARMA